MINGNWCEWCGLSQSHQTKDECIAALRDQNAETPERLSLKGGVATPEREAAISEYLANHARQDAALVAFRRTASGGQLLKPDPQTIARWIEEQKQQEHGPLHAITVLVPRGRPANVIPRFGKITRVSCPSLAFPGAGQYVSRTPISYGGVLDRLRGLAEALSARYTWGQAEAVAFILSDWTPIVRQVSARFEQHSLSPVLNRIHFSVDPAVSPQELMARYRRMRRELAGHARDISDKRIRLASFCAVRPPDETYAVMMKAWNKAQPKDKYSQVSNFGRDAWAAVKKVFGIDLKRRKGATK